MEGNWDINKYYNKLEPNEQWEMKKKFMEAHKNSFPEERVVCLAQVLVNIEFLGTRYPAETMKTVAEFSHGIVDDYRERQKTRLQRTFVGAEDATKAKYNKGEVLKTTSNSVKKAIDDKSQMSDKVSVVANEDVKCILPKQKTGKRKLSESVNPLENMEQLSEKKKPKKKKKKLAASEGFLKDTATNSVENNSNKSSQEIVDGKNTIPSLEDNKEGGSEGSVAKQTTETKKSKKKNAKNKLKSESLLIEERKNTEEKQPVKANKKNKSLKKVGKADAGNGVEEQLPKVSAKKKKAANKFEQEDVKGHDVGKQIIPGPPRSSLQQRLLAIAGLETARNDRSGKDSNCAYKPIPRFVLIKLSKKVDKLNSFESSIIQSSAQLSGVSYEIETRKLSDQEWETTIYLDRQLVVRDVSENRCYCIKSASKKAIALLKKHHYQIIIDKQGTTSIPQFLIGLEDALENELKGTKAKKICASDANNEKTDGNSKAVETVQPTVALKMMKLMGWKGLGLGAKEQGIQEPIEATTVVNRNGLGFDTNCDFGKSVKTYLNNYLTSGSLQKLVFVDFTKEQRAKIHAEAQRLNLFTQSKGNKNAGKGSKNARVLTVRRDKPVITYLRHWVSLIESRINDPLFKDIIVKPPKAQSS